MLRSLPCLLLVPTALVAIAQPQNALDFDGVDDRVTVQNASALVTNSTGLALTCWVWPRNGAPAFPDFDGIAGMRNELDCDFYLLQLEAGVIEGRLRNSNGEVFTVTGSGLQLNTWQSLVLNYDGSALTLWRNGEQIGTVPASGSITSTTTPLWIGDITFQIYEFWLNGKVDEVSLWRRALDQQEISCLTQTPPTFDDENCVLYYNCDQGTPGGNNTSITELTDVNGNLNGTFSGLALTGNGSNFVQGTSFGTTVNANLCPGETYIFNGEEISEPGAYTASFPTGGACDSVVTLILSQIPVNVSVNATATQLTSLNGSATWQWLDCANGFAEIPGATFQTYVPTTNGSYAVEVTGNGCVDTSACYDMTSIGLVEHLALLPGRLTPTITSGPIRLQLDAPDGLLSLIITDALGRQVMRFQAPAKDEQWFDVSALPAGTYSLMAKAGGRSLIQRFVKD